MEETDEKDCPKGYSRHVCDLQSSYLTLSEAAFVPAAACAALYASIRRTLHTAFKQLQIKYTKTIHFAQTMDIKPRKEACWLNTVTTSHVSRLLKTDHCVHRDTRNESDIEGRSQYAMTAGG